MKKFSLFIVFFCACIEMYAMYNQHDSSVEVRLISDKEENISLFKTMENNASVLLSAINEAQHNNRVPVLPNDMKQIEPSILKLWDNSPFYCTDEKIVERCIATSAGHQIRNIPLLMTPKDPDKYIDDTYQECVIEFNKLGQIESFHLALANNLYASLLRKSKDVSDARHRQQILNYLERYRTAYATRDSVFIEQVFGNDELILTSTEYVYTKPGVELTRPDKSLFGRLVKRGFRQNGRCQISLDSIVIMQHPNPKRSFFYGVTVLQTFRTADYYDKGYLFMLWNFKDEERPEILLRTWQPERYPDGTKLSEEDIFSLSTCVL